MKPLPDIQLSFLDHVAIRVKDMDASAKWYERVLGLKPYTFKEWGPFPIFMLSGQFGVALFPVKSENPLPLGKKDFIKIDHFAFNVNRENFEHAKKRYQLLDLDFEIQDHHYFHSIYTKDLDGHIVELTTLVVAEASFYRLKQEE